MLVGACIVLYCSLNGLVLAQGYTIKADDCDVVITEVEFLKKCLEVEAVLYGVLALCDARPIK